MASQVDGVRVLSVKDYGAFGDGETMDTAALRPRLIAARHWAAVLSTSPMGRITLARWF